MGNWSLGHVFFVHVLYKCHSTKLYWENPQAHCHLYAGCNNTDKWYFSGITGNYGDNDFIMQTFDLEEVGS